jgi:branched-chain amino acid transport system substrate-binding protein
MRSNIQRGKAVLKPITLLAGMVAVGCVHGADVSADGRTIVLIGHVGPLTGQLSNMGKDSENGALLAIEEVNRQNLVVGGRKIELRLDTQDDAADPKTGTQVAQKLVDDGVVDVVGHINSGVSIPASKIYSDAGIVEISPASTNPAYTQQGYKTTYRDVATDARQGPALATFAAKTLHAKSVAIVDDSTAYGQGLADELAKSFKAQGANIVTREATNDKATDFRAILTKIKGLNPDIIMFGGSDATAGPFARQSAGLGIRAKILGGDGMCTERIADLAGDGLNNVVCSVAGLALAKMPKGAEFEKNMLNVLRRPYKSSLLLAMTPYM